MRGNRLPSSSAAPFNAAAPGAIGGTTPAAGTFTVLTATGQILAADGAVGAPGLSWSQELTSGWYRIGAGNFGLSILGVKRGDWNGVSLMVPQAADATYQNASFHFGTARTSGSPIALSGFNGSVYLHAASQQILKSTTTGVTIPLTYGLLWNSTSAGTDNGVSTGISSHVANSVQFAATTNSAGAATSRTEINKTVASIADATPTALFTVTVPNAAHSASILVHVGGALGAGGAIGADESTQGVWAMVSVTRTAGVNAVATISALAAAPAAASVAGANNAATTLTLSAISGAVGAVNTFTVNGTITRSAGASANHNAVAHASLLNRNATGVTIA